MDLIEDYEAYIARKEAKKQKRNKLFAKLIDYLRKRCNCG